MKILLRGKHGLVRFELQRAMVLMGEIMDVNHHVFDFADSAAIRYLIAYVASQIIGNPAAYTAVDKAESEPELVQAINSSSPDIFGQEAKKLGALVRRLSLRQHKAGRLHRRGQPQIAKDRWPDQAGRRTCAASRRHRQPDLSGQLSLWCPWRQLCYYHVALRHRTRCSQYRRRSMLRLDLGSVACRRHSAGYLPLPVRGAGTFPSDIYHLVAGGLITLHVYAQTCVRAAEAAAKRLKVRGDDISHCHHRFPLLSHGRPTRTSPPSACKPPLNCTRSTGGAVSSTCCKKYCD